MPPGGIVTNLSQTLRKTVSMRLFSTFFALSFILSPTLDADVLISEFLADNANGIEDENGDRSDWVELFNTGATPVSLDGWWLTDKASEEGQWRFPAVTIPANGTLLVWASGKNRVNPAAPLHTNFSLSKTGEFLGLYQPHPVSGQPQLVHSYGTAYPPQAPDISYGVAVGQSTTTLVGSGAGQLARYRVLPNNATGAGQYSGGGYSSGEVGTGLAGGWNRSAGFDDSTWNSGATGVGYDTGGGLNAWINTNCRTALQNVNTSLLFRRTFALPDPAEYVSYKLRIKYEDGFVAWLNGIEIARANFNGTPTYNSASTAALEETIVNSWTEFTIPSTALLAGNNVLAIQGLNSSLGSSDFLLLPEILGASDLSSGGEVYFNPPTPNAINGNGSAGPVVFDATPVDPAVPRPLGTAASPPLKVTVRVIKTKNNIATVRAYTRVMWNPESAALLLSDAGTGADSIAGDGIYSGNLPTNGVAPGQMLRWRFEAQDSAGGITKFPAFADPVDSPQYFGTVAANAATATSQLPVLEWFVEGAPVNGPTAGAFRGACYYLNRFYDNIGHEIHGQSTAGFGKKSYDFDSNDDHRFVWKEGERPVKDLNLLSNWADKTKARNTLSHEVGKLAGTPYHFAFPVRVQLNGAFHGVLDLVEDGDDRMLERNGLDGEGALYKIYSENLTSGAEKKTRKQENQVDLGTMAAALDPSLQSLVNRRTYAYDNVNIAAAVNYLVVRQLNSDRDHGQKNFYLYRDTNRTGQWRPIIWDVDLSQGHNWTGTYFDDTLIANNPLNAHSTNDRFYNIILESPEFRQMWVRRMRTLMDQILQPPGTANGLLETRMRQIAASIDPEPAASSWTDGDLDASRWGYPSGFAPNRPREEVERVVTGYFGPRRTFLFNTGPGRPALFSPDGSANTAVPNTAQVNAPGMVSITAVDYLPAGGNQAAEYVVLKNNLTQAADISGWTLDGALDYVFEGGTVINVGNGSVASDYQGLLHLVKDVNAFRSRTTGPKGGERRLIQGNYGGQLSARGETLNLRDPSGQLIASFSWPGTPSDLQQYLRISELQYHPADPGPLEQAGMPGMTGTDLEYIEFVNIGPSALDLSGAKFTEGIGFTFGSTSLPAGERLVLARNPAAFALRYPSTTEIVLGPYDGDLDNGGERLQIVDAVGENILDFEYKDGWYPATDGSGHSLVVRDPAGLSYKDFGDPRSWAISGDELGSPAEGDGFFAQSYQGWDNFHFTSAERDDLLVAGPEADPDGDGRSNAEEYALATDPRVRDLPQQGFAWSMDGEIRRPALKFRRPAHALDLGYQLQASDDLGDWSVITTEPVSSSPLPGEAEEVIFRDETGDEAKGRFLRLGYFY